MQRGVHLEELEHRLHLARLPASLVGVGAVCPEVVEPARQRDFSIRRRLEDEVALEVAFGIGEGTAVAARQ